MSLVDPPVPSLTEPASTSAEDRSEYGSGAASRDEAPRREVARVIVGVLSMPILGALVSGAVIGAIALVLLVISTIAAITGNVQVICAAALAWLAFCASVYAFGGIATSIVELASVAAQSTPALLELWEKYASPIVELRPLYERRLSEKMRGHVDRAEAISEELEQYSPFWSFLVAVFVRMCRIFQAACLTLVAVSVFVARLAAEAHLGLAGSGYQGMLTHIRAAWSTTDPLLWTSALLCVMGVVGDSRRYFKRRAQAQADLARPGAAAMAAGAPGILMLFFATFEFVRLILLFTCGLFGARAFAAAQTVLTNPQQGSVLGVPLPTPITAFSPIRQQAAFDLYHELTPVVYWAIFGLLPLLVVLWQGTGFVRNRWHSFRRRPKPFPFRPGAEWYAALVLCTWTVLLSLTVAARTGDARRVVLEVARATEKDPARLALLSCQLDLAKSDVTRELACWQRFVRDSRAATIIRDSIVSLRLTKTERRQWRAERDRWAAGVRQEVSRRGRVPGDSLSVQLETTKWEAISLETRLRNQAAALDRLAARTTAP